MDTDKKRVDLRRIFANLQRQMITRFSTQQQAIGHPTARGDASELNWVGLLDSYLPERYKVDRAFVLDHEGTLSQQIDLVIYDRQYSPFLFKDDGAKYIPAESVYAVFEIRPCINKRVVTYAGEKAASVRTLKRTSVKIPHAGGIYPRKRPFRLVAGILTLASDWKPPLAEGLRRGLADLRKEQRLDLGCVLECGGFEAKYGRSVTIQKSAQHEALIFFFLRLLSRLQRLGTAPALDLSKYGRALG